MFVIDLPAVIVLAVLLLMLGGSLTYFIVAWLRKQQAVRARHEAAELIAALALEPTNQPHAQANLLKQLIAIEQRVPNQVSLALDDVTNVLDATIRSSIRETDPAKIIPARHAFAKVLRINAAFHEARQKMLHLA